LLVWLIMGRLIMDCESSSGRSIENLKLWNQWNNYLWSVFGFFFLFCKPPLSLGYYFFHFAPFFLVIFESFNLLFGFHIFGFCLQETTLLALVESGAILLTLFYWRCNISKLDVRADITFSFYWYLVGIYLLISRENHTMPRIVLLLLKKPTYCSGNGH
jgi:hypothetical protein